MSAILFVEGGGDSKELHGRCRKGFSQLLKSCGYHGRMPKIVACGGRGSAYNGFKIENQQGRYDFVAMMVDSEEPLQDLNGAWEHLNRRDGWNQPQGASDDQVLLMTTCMETWIVADRSTLKRHYGHCLQESALPSLAELEARRRHDIQGSLKKATGKCSNKYEKGKRSFAVLALLNPTEIEKHLPSFARMKRILDAELR